MRRTLLLALLLAIAVASPAAAQSGTIGGAGAGYPVAGPVFGDGELVWAERDDSLALRLVAGGLGRASQVLATADPPALARSVSASLGATRSAALLYGLWETPGKGTSEPVGTVALAGPRAALRRLGDGADATYAFPRLVGDRVVYAAGFGLDGAIRFVDPVTGERTDVPSTAAGAWWDVDGDLLAHRRPGEGREPVVTNWRTGEELYRAVPPPDFTPHSVQVAADGTSVWSGMTVDGDGATRYRIAVATPQDPAMRLVPLPDGSASELAHGRVLLREYGGGDWLVGDLGGRVLARLAQQRVATAAPGFDGRRLAWLARPCALPVVSVLDVDDPPAPKGVTPPRCIGATLAGRPRVRAGGLHVPLRCDGSEAAGCLTEATVLVRRHGGRTLRFSTGVLSHVAGEEHVVRVGRARALRGRLRVTVVLRAARDGSARDVARFRLRG